MKPDEIARILAAEDAITPSPRFLASVMRAVEQEAVSLPPLAFPWARALPGWLALVAGFIGAGIALARDPASSQALDAQLGRLASVASGLELQWVALAMLVTLASLVTASSLVRGGDYA